MAALALGGLLVRFDTGGPVETVDPDREDELGTITLKESAPLGFINLALDGAVMIASVWLAAASASDS